MWKAFQLKDTVLPKSIFNEKCQFQQKKKINHLKTSRFFLLDQFLRKMKMKACIVLHVLGSGEYTLPAG